MTNQGESPEISVVIPAYNEERALTAHFEAIVPLLDSLFPNSWEIVVFDDGSLDRTVEVARNFSHPRIRVSGHTPNRGKGAAVRGGFLITKGKRVLLTDADMSTPPTMLPKFLKALDQGFDIVIGNRIDARSEITRKQSLGRRFFGNGFIYLSRWLTKTRITDFNCGFKLFRGEVAREILEVTETPRWAYDLELLALAARRGYKIAELPVEWRHMDNSAVRLPLDIFRTLSEMARIWLRLRRDPKAVADG